LPLEFDPYPGYWRVTIQQPGRPAETRWFAYDQKNIAELFVKERPYFMAPFRSKIELDTEFDPDAFEHFENDVEWEYY